MIKYQEFNFNWRGKNDKGKVVTGTHAFLNEQLLKRFLEHKGITIISFKKKNVSKIAYFTSKNIQRKDILAILTSLSYSLKCGMQLIQCLEVILSNEKKFACRQLLYDIIADVRGGKSLSVSLAKHSKYFSRELINLVVLGEKTHSLDAVLDSARDYITGQQILARKITKAMLYPMTVLVVALVVAYILLTQTVPEFERIFAQSDIPLPAITQIVVNISAALQKPYVYIGILLTVILPIAIAKLKLLAPFKHAVIITKMHRLVFTIPVIGQLLIKSFLISYARYIAISLRSGASLADSLQAFSTLHHAAVLKTITVDIANQVSNGEALSRSLDRISFFPPQFYQLVSVGETSHNLEKMLLNSADIFEQDIEFHVHTIISLTETAIILILGLLVGFFILAMYLPMFNIGNIV